MWTQQINLLGVRSRNGGVGQPRVLHDVLTILAGYRKNGGRYGHTGAMPGDWKIELAELRRRQADVREMGGAERVERQKKGGRLTVRECILSLAERGTFHEIGTVAGSGEYDDNGHLVVLNASNCVMGRASIDGRLVVISGDDFTQRGGSADATIKDKAAYPEEMARELRLPILRLIEGSGGGGSVKTIETTGRPNLPGGVGTKYDVMP